MALGKMDRVDFSTFAAKLAEVRRWRKGAPLRRGIRANLLQSVPLTSRRPAAKYERKETLMKSPLRNSFAACAAATLALVPLTALVQSCDGQQEGKTKVEHLLEAELDKSWADENGWTQLHWAAAADDGEAARRLLKLGMTASPAAKGDGSEFSGEGRRRAGLLGQDADGWANTGETPLQVAAAFNASVVASILIANDADIRAKDSGGVTPLYTAAFWNAAAVAKLLIDNGAEVNAKDEDGETPMDAAIYKVDGAMQSLLRQHGGECGKNC